ncbi:MAG: cupin-like domain-containing protein [Sphingomonas sp.]|nr:cupin-like domain-containing protein [Sphingomonas sp.]
MLDAEIRPLGQPAVLRGLAAHWPVVRAGKQSEEAGLDYFRRFGQDREIEALLGAPEIEGRFFYSPDLKGMNFLRGQVSLRDFYDRLLRDRTAHRPYSLALQSEVIPNLLPGFVEENPLAMVEPRVQPRLWMGNTIHVAPHYDLMENLGIVVMGRRRFTVFPPHQLDNLYMGPIELTPAGTPVSLVDIANPDLVRFPRYAEAANHAQSTILEPGDAIYLPFHWWHAVDSLEKVNAFVNYWWNDARPGMGNPYDALMYGLFALRGLPPEQREAWRLMFNRLVFESDGDPVAHLPEEAKGVLGPTTDKKLAMMRATLRQIMARL